MELKIRDRLSWMRFFGFTVGDPMPDESTIRHFRNRMTETGTLRRVMKAFDRQLYKKGYIAMSGQILDATLVPAPKQRNNEGEKAAIRDGKTAEEIWPDKPNKAVRKDVDARWTLKIGGKIRYRPDGTPLRRIAQTMLRNTAKANAEKSSVRAKVEHGFAHQTARFGLFIRTIGLARAEAKLTLANRAYNFDRLIFHERSMATG